MSNLLPLRTSSSSVTHNFPSSSSSSSTENSLTEIKNFGNRNITQGDVHGEVTATKLFASSTAAYVQQSNDRDKAWISSLIRFLQQKGIEMPSITSQEWECLHGIFEKYTINLFPSFSDVIFHDFYFDLKKSAQSSNLLLEPDSRQSPVCCFYLRVPLNTILKRFAETFGEFLLSILRQNYNRSSNVLSRLVKRKQMEKGKFCSITLASCVNNLDRLQKTVENFLNKIPQDDRERLLVKIAIIRKLLSMNHGPALLTLDLSSCALSSSPETTSSPTQAFFHIQEIFKAFYPDSIQREKDHDFLLELIDFHIDSMGTNLHNEYLTILKELRGLVLDSKLNKISSKEFNDYLGSKVRNVISSVQMTIEFQRSKKTLTCDMDISNLTTICFFEHFDGVYNGTIGRRTMFLFLRRIENSFKLFISFYEGLVATNDMDIEFNKTLQRIFTDKQQLSLFITKCKNVLSCFNGSDPAAEKVQKIFESLKKISIKFNSKNTISLMKQLHKKYSDQITELYKENPSSKKIVKIKEAYFSKSTHLLLLFLIFHDIAKVQQQDFTEEADSAILSDELLDTLDPDIDTDDIIPEKLELPYNQEEDDETLTTSFLPLSSYPTPLPPTSSSLSSSSLPSISSSSLPPTSGLLSSSSSSSPSLPLTSSSLSSSSVPSTSTPSLPPTSGLLSSSSVPSTSTPSLPPTSGLLSSSSSSSLFPPSTSSSSSTTRPRPRTLQQASSSSSSSSSTSRADAIEKSRLLKILSKRRKLLKFFREERKLVASSKNDGSGHTSFSTIDGKKEGGAPNHGPGTKIRRKTLFKILKDTE